MIDPLRQLFSLRAPPALGVRSGTPLRGPKRTAPTVPRKWGPVGGSPFAHQGAERRGGARARRRGKIGASARSGTSPERREEARPGAALQLGAGIAAERRGVGGAAAALDGDR